MVGPWIRRSQAASFGAFPTGTETVQLPEGQRAKKVLEIFLYGGLSPWETLYFVRDYGTATMRVPEHAVLRVPDLERGGDHALRDQ